MSRRGGKPAASAFHAFLAGPTHGFKNNFAALTVTDGLSGLKAIEPKGKVNTRGRAARHSLPKDTVPSAFSHLGPGEASSTYVTYLKDSIIRKAINTKQTLPTAYQPEEQATTQLIRSRPVPRVDATERLPSNPQYQYLVPSC
ncbi:hypothetical protein PG990_009069 [Apiospora arundinis]